MTNVYRNMLLLLLCAAAVCLLCPLCSCHGHDHDHDHHEHGHDQRPSFKYSREANQPVDGHVREHGHAHHHGHAQNQGHARYHVHDFEHGHHYGHGHGDEDDHGHGHDHDHNHVHHHGHAHEHDHVHHHVFDHEHVRSPGDFDEAGSVGEGERVRYSREVIDDDDRGHSDDAKLQRVRDDSSAIPAADSGLTLWAISLGSTALISISPVIVLLLIPLENASEQQPLLKVLLSFASGGLLGDAFLHLIPHAIMSRASSSSSATHGHSHDGHGHAHDGHGHSHDGHGHSHADDHNLTVGLWVLFGIVAFLAVEKFVRYVKGGGHSHNMVHVSDNGHSPVDDNKSPNNTDNKKKTVKKSSVTVAGDKKKTPHSTQGEEDIKVAGYLNLAADFAHNFTDGLAIGASYAAGRSVGIITMLTILLHEVPHEVGDFAILMQSGCSRRKAMMLQLTTAVGALLGTVCSLLAEGIGNAATAWILPFTAGGFIYIATVSVIPELLHDSKIGQSLMEIVALVSGVAMMVVIATYE